MATLPEFTNARGHTYRVLPDGVHPCDEQQMREHLVDSFPESETRIPIYKGFCRLRADTARRGLTATQWIDGSFVEDKLHPGDVDIVTFIDYDELNASDKARQRFVTETLAGGESTKPQYLTHTFFVPCCAVDHPFYSVYERHRSYWRKWFGTTRSGNPKGILAMAVGDPARAPAVSTHRSEP